MDELGTSRCTRLRNVVYLSKRKLKHMKKLLLSFAAVCLTAAGANAQSCTPGANFADSTYGVWCNCTETVENMVDTITNFPDGLVGVFYSEDMNFKVPSTVTEELTGGDPTLAFAIGMPIDGFVVDAVQGLPPGLDFACSTVDCSYNGGDNGCANLYGTPTTAGVYDVIIKVTGTINTGILGTIDQPVDFDGYRITIGTAGEISLEKDKFSVFPNPANNEVTINGLEDLNVSSLEIVNMAGATVKAYDNVNTPSFNMNIADLENGMYFIKINHDITELVKFIKK